MKVLMFGTDVNSLISGSDTQKRLIEYGSLVGEIHLVLLKKNSEIKDERLEISRNVWVYPTNCPKWQRIFLAYKIGKKIIHDSEFLPAGRHGMIHDSLITAQDPFETGLVGYWLKKKFGIPLQLQIHTDFMNSYFRAESLKNRARYWLGKFLVKRADCVRVVSNRIKNSLLKIIDQGLKINILPIFVDVQKIKNAPIKIDLHKKYPGRFIILMASRLTKEKNISLAIEAIKKVKDRGLKIKDFLLLIVGEGPERKNIQFLISNYQLQNDIVLESWTDDLISYYKTADLFLLTSNYEGYGRTAVEALAVDLSVVMTDVGLAREIVHDGENGLIVPVGDVSALAVAIKKSINEPRELARWRSNSQKYLPKLNKEENLAMYKKIWESC